MQFGECFLLYKYSVANNLIQKIYEPFAVFITAKKVIIRRILIKVLLFCILITLKQNSDRQ